ncbi:MAG: RHS repeat-associated core domain-containing protein [Candidatus Acidiferrales bacterium]
MPWAAASARLSAAQRFDYVYELGGHVVLDALPNGFWTTGYVYLNGQLVAQYSGANTGTTYFVHRDHLGSTRLLTGMNQSVYDSLDYLPFGEQVAGGTGSSHKFTGYERDSETGVDYAMARHMSSSLGRFMSPDPWGGDRRNPQTLNRYTYVVDCSNHSKPFIAFAVVSFDLIDPLSDVEGTIFELDAIRLAPGKKFHGILVDKRHVLQIQFGLAI